MNGFDTPQTPPPLANDLLAEILIASPECLSVSTFHEGRFIISSDAFERLLGYDRSEVIGHTGVELGIWPRAEDRESLLKEIQKNGSVRNRMTQVRRRTGELLDVAITMAPIVIKGQQCVIALTADHSKRKAADEQLRRNEERMRRALEVEGFGVWELDFVAGRVHLDERLLELYGMRPEQVPQDIEGWTALMHPQDRERVGREMNHCFEGRTRFFNVDFRGKHSSGEYLWVRVKGAVVARDHGGRPLRAIGTTTDITDNKRIEQELLDKQTQLQGIAANIPGVVYQCVAYPDGSIKVSHVAGRALETFGVPTDGTDIFSWFARQLDPEDQQRFVATSYEAIEKGGPWHFEGRFNLQSGEQRWVEGMSLPQKVDGKLVFNGVFLDVTERRRAEQESRKNQDRYERILKTSQDGVWISDAEFRTVYVNEKLASILGYTVEEMMGLPVLRLHLEEDWCLIDSYLENRRKGQHSIYETRLRRKDGTGVWTSISASAMMDSSGKFEGSFAMIKDITAQKQIEDSLKQSEASYRALFEHAQDAILLLQGHQCIRFNRRALEMFGLDEEEMRKTPPYLLSPVRQRDGSLSSEESARLNAEALAGHPQLFEWVHQRRDGVQFDVEVSLSRVKYPGSPVIQAVVRDISDRKRAQAQQQALQAQLIHAQKMEAVGQLAGGVAHDFNNIITAILMHLNLLKADRQMPKAMVSSLMELETEAKRAANLTRQLLMFSRRQVLQPTVFDINVLLGNLLKMLRRLIGEHISLIFDGTPEDLWVEADPGMIEQVVVNLIVNARDAMPNGGSITINTRQIDISAGSLGRNSGARPGRFVCLEISDLGSGIDPSIVNHIFEPFFTTKEEGKGTGLGLATVYGIITQHDGWVDVESKLGEGSCFRVFLPFVAQGPASADRASVAESIPGGRETILLVEDESSVRRNASMLLRELGYEVLEALTGQEALKVWKANRERIRLLLTDMVMPGGLTGLELGDQLLREKTSLKVILMSGYSAEMVRDGIFNRKGMVFLQKPFGAPTLARAVRDSLDANGSGYVATYGNTPG